MPDIVYVLTVEYPYEGSTLLGVYANQDDAKAAGIAYLRKHCYSHRSWWTASYNPPDTECCGDNDCAHVAVTRVAVQHATTQTARPGPSPP